MRRRSRRAVGAPLNRRAALQALNQSINQSIGFGVRDSFPLQIADVAAQDAADAQVGDKQVQFIIALQLCARAYMRCAMIMYRPLQMPKRRRFLRRANRGRASALNPSRQPLVGPLGYSSTF